MLYQDDPRAIALDGINAERLTLYPLLVPARFGDDVLWTRLEDLDALEAHVAGEWVQ